MAEYTLPPKIKRDMEGRIKEFLTNLRNELNLPEHSRIVVDNEHGYFDARVVCSGAKPGMAYVCCLPPNHSGYCYSKEKNVDFNPETYYG